MNCDQGEIAAVLRDTPRCKECGLRFVPNEGEAGSKYCSAACKARGYRPDRVDRRTPDEIAAAPRCRMCARPAHWSPSRRAYAAYCSGRSCDNTVRTCQRCSKQYVPNFGGATGKYCSPACVSGGIRLEACLECGRPGTARRQWPGVCDACAGPLRNVMHSLAKHHVPWAKMRHLLAEPRCDICKREIVNARDGQRPVLNVDHDHGCCPGSYSCGRCVRGFLCAQCNSVIGYARDDIAIVRSAVAYLERHGA